jgi:PHD/YefM family antitoxin component YafN of YafNO toxin-antitoxin module
MKEYNKHTRLLFFEVILMINIRPSAAIRKNYNEIADLCKRTGEPVFLTKNGSGDLVVLDIETYTRRDSMLKLRESLLRSEEDRIAGKSSRSVDEVAYMMREAIREVADAKRD